MNLWNYGFSATKGKFAGAGELKNAATCIRRIGTILQAKGDLEGALRYTQRALKIDEKVFGANHPTTKLIAANLEQIEAQNTKRH